MIQKAEGGFFYFRNLPVRRFKIYALQDLNHNMHYDPVSERMGYYANTVNPADSARILLFTFAELAKADTAFNRKGSSKQLSASQEKKVETRLNYTINTDTANKSKRSFDLFDSVRIRFDKPVKTVDAGRIKVMQDVREDNDAVVQTDSDKKTILISTRWKDETMYKIILLKGFAQDSAGLQAAAAELVFKTKRMSEYGTLKVVGEADDSKWLELLKGDRVVAAKPMTDSLVVFPFLAPDNYQLRILHDVNHNHRWDSGTFWPEKRPPEITELLPSMITLRANWENKIDLRLQKK